MKTQADLNKFRDDLRNQQVNALEAEIDEVLEHLIEDKFDREGLSSEELIKAGVSEEDLVLQTVIFIDDYVDEIVDNMILQDQVRKLVDEYKFQVSEFDFKLVFEAASTKDEYTLTITDKVR